MDIYQTFLVRQFVRNLIRSLAVILAIRLILFLPVVREVWPVDWSLGGETATRVVVVGIQMLDAVLPLALLIATLFTVAPAVRHREIMALNAAGRTTLQILWPLVGVAGLAAFYGATVRLWGVPTVEMSATAISGEAADRTANHAIWTSPLVNLYAVVAGIVIASVRREKTVYRGFLLAVLLIAGYYVLASTTLAFGRYGYLPPVIAAWLPSVIMGVALCVLWWRLRL